MRSWGFLLLLLIETASAPAWAATETLTFPESFRWCVATAAHQIEGDNRDSDWWAFEHLPGTIKNGDVSGAACDHWNRVEEDTRLMRDLHVRQYRLSIEWAKIEPREGQWSEAALLHYAIEIAGLKAAGISPFITLHHFTLPQWLRAKGGWEWEGAPEAFERFTRKAYEALGAGVVDWTTFNEPMVHVVGGYLAGLTPPQKQNVQEAAIAIKGILRAHARAYKTLHDLAKAAGRPVRVGIAAHLRVFDPYNPINPADRVAAKVFDRNFNWSFLDALKTGRLEMWIPLTLSVDEKIPGLAGTQDFLGINYYSRDMVQVSLDSGTPLPAKLMANETSFHNDLGWEIYPYGFYRVLKKAHARYPGLPILVTENGTADSSDAFRARYLKDHLKALHKAMSEGVPAESYCHWSLLDNFEWVEGFEPRFGLYEMDYSTMSRIARPSAAVFEEIARTGKMARDPSVPWGTWRIQRP